MTDGLATPESRKAVIFIVDDEPEMLWALGRLLEGWGYRVCAFESALAALDALAGNRVALVISDQFMPKLQGLAFLREVRRRHPLVPTVLMTGGLTADEIKIAVANGEIDGFVLKPFDLAELSEIVRELVARARAT